MIKRSTIRTLRSLRAKEAVAPLRRMLINEKVPVVWDIMRALTAIEGANAIELLKTALESPNRNTCNVALSCLDNLNDPSAKEILCEKLLETDPDIAGQAAIYLHPGLDENGLKAVLAAIKQRRKAELKPAPEIVKCLGRVSGEVGWNLLLEYLEADEPEYRSAAVQTLGSRPEFKEAIIVLRKRLKEEKNKEVREVIIQALRNYNAVLKEGF